MQEFIKVTGIIDTQVIRQSNICYVCGKEDKSFICCFYPHRKRRRFSWYGVKESVEEILAMLNESACCARQEFIKVTEELGYKSYLFRKSNILRLYGDKKSCTINFDISKKCGLFKHNCFMKLKNVITGSFRESVDEVFAMLNESTYKGAKAHGSDRA